MSDAEEWFSTADGARYLDDRMAGGWHVSTQTLRRLAQNRRIEFYQRTPCGKFWFEKGVLDRFLSAFLIPTADGKQAVSTAVRSSKILLAGKYMPGELVTKADAALMLGLKIRGIEHLVANKELRPAPVNLGYRTVAFVRKSVVALQRNRMRARRGIPKKQREKIADLIRLFA
jgi:hypothetical protein